MGLTFNFFIALSVKHYLNILFFAFDILPVLYTSNRGIKGTREGKKGAKEGKKDAAALLFLPSWNIIDGDR